MAAAAPAAAAGAGFPESPAYLARVRAMPAQRQGPFYVMLHAETAPRKGWRDEAERAHAQREGRLRPAQGADTLANYGMALDAASCRQYRSMTGKRRLAYQLCVVTPRP